MVNCDIFVTTIQAYGEGISIFKFSCKDNYNAHCNWRSDIHQDEARCLIGTETDHATALH